MAHVFISYSRKNQEYAQALAEDIRKHGFDVWIDDRIDYGDRWWRTIVKAIEVCGAFIIVMSPAAEESEWVEREILLAQRSQKPIFPLLLDGKEFALLITTQFADVRDQNLPPTDFYQRIDAVLTPSSTIGEYVAPKPPVQKEAKSTASRQLSFPLNKEIMVDYVRQIFIGVIVTIIGGVILAFIIQSDRFAPNSETPTNPAVAQNTTPDATLTLEAKITQIIATNVAQETATAAAFTLTPSPSATATATQTPNITQTSAAQNTEAAVIAAERLATQRAQLTANAPTNTTEPTATATSTPTETPQPTASPTNTPTITPDLPATAAAATSVAQEALATINAQETLVARSGPTSEVFPTLTLVEETVSLVRITSNVNANVRSGPGENFAVITNVAPDMTYEFLEERSGWYRISDNGWVSSQVAELKTYSESERDFNGVIMVLVPAGCFLMGSNNGNSDEQPVHEICFEDPFWIDKYEVTNGQSDFFGYWTDDSLPLETVNWFSAKDFCGTHRGRLPTEAEWEYAARGPNNWIYPWGNEFISTNVVYDANSNSQNAPVGSRSAGASWVGALDMSGNVLEWTLSEYRDYPYDPADGRENITADSRRVVRGGSWISAANGLRTADRRSYDPNFTGNLLGFRCMRQVD